MDKGQSNIKRAKILGYPVDVITKQEALDAIHEGIKTKTGKHVVTLNPEMIFQSRQNIDLHNSITSANVIIPDGVGVVYGLKRVGYKDIKRVPGIEFSEGLIELCAQNGYKVAFLGATKDTIEEAVKQLQIKHPSLNAVFVRDGYFTESDEEEIINNIKQSEADVLFAALGVPKQELFIAKYKNILNSTIMVGVGGSFDVWAKKVKRAPAFFRNLGLEWFYRLLCQPSRFSRMFPTLPMFMIEVTFDKKNTGKEF